jgi:hypothetical protein
MWFRISYNSSNMTAYRASYAGYMEVTPLADVFFQDNRLHARFINICCWRIAVWGFHLPRWIHAWQFESHWKLRNKGKFPIKPVLEWACTTSPTSKTIYLKKILQHTNICPPSTILHNHLRPRSFLNIYHFQVVWLPTSASRMNKELYILIIHT